MWKLILIGRSYTLIWDLDFKSAQCDKEIQEEPTTEVYLYYYFFFMRDIFEGIQTLNVDEWESSVLTMVSLQLRPVGGTKYFLFLCHCVVLSVTG